MGFIISRTQIIFERMGDAWDVWDMPGFFVEFELSEISMYGPCMAHAWDVWEDSFQANCFKFSLILI